MAVSPEAKAVGDRVRAAMVEGAWSQTTLGRRIGMAQSQMSRRLSGVIPFRATELAAIADVLGVPASSLMADRESVAA